MDKRTYDIDTIVAVESVTYGSHLRSNYRQHRGWRKMPSSSSKPSKQRQTKDLWPQARLLSGVGVSETVADTLALKSQASIISCR